MRHCMITNYPTTWRSYRLFAFDSTIHAVDILILILSTPIQSWAPPPLATTYTYSTLVNPCVAATLATWQMPCLFAMETCLHVKTFFLWLIVVN